MKLYRFYTKPSQALLVNSDDLDIKDKYPLYAFTNDKTMRDQFVKDRDMSKFIQRSSKVSKEEFIDFSNRNTSYLLNLYDYEHLGYPKERGGVTTITSAAIVSTWFEKDLVSSICDDGYEYITANMAKSLCPLIFDKKYVKALDVLGYTDLWKAYGDVDMLEKIFSEDIVDEYISYGYGANMVVDQFSIYIDQYGSTFKK